MPCRAIASFGHADQVEVVPPQFLEKRVRSKQERRPKWPRRRSGMIGGCDDLTHVVDDSLEVIVRQ